MLELEHVQADIRDFHTITGLPVRDRPDLGVTDETLRLRRNLIEEEAREAVEAIEEMYLGGATPERMAHAAKELADVIVVAMGSAVSLGIEMSAVWREVHRSNMAKKDPATGMVKRRPDGKILKPDGWTPPEIEPIIRAQMAGVV